MHANDAKTKIAKPDVMSRGERSAATRIAAMMVAAVAKPLRSTIPSMSANLARARHVPARGMELLHRQSILLTIELAIGSNTGKISE